MIIYRLLLCAVLLAAHRAAFTANVFVMDTNDVIGAHVSQSLTIAPDMTSSIAMLLSASHELLSAQLNQIEATSIDIRTRTDSGKSHAPVPRTENSQAMSSVAQGENGEPVFSVPLIVSVFSSGLFILLRLSLRNAEYAQALKEA